MRLSESRIYAKSECESSGRFSESFLKISERRSCLQALVDRGCRCLAVGVLEDAGRKPSFGVTYEENNVIKGRCDTVLGIVEPPSTYDLDYYGMDCWNVPF